MKQARDQRQKDAETIARHGAEVAELRKRLDKVKRRAAQSGQRKGSPKLASVQQGVELELEQTRRARDEAKAEALALSQELSRLRSQARLPKPTVEPLLDNAGIESLQQQLQSANRTAEAARLELSNLSKSDERLKRKLATQEVLYVSIRSELDAKKDRLRTQQEELERLMALKVALMDSPQDAPLASDSTLVPESAGGDSAAAAELGEGPIEPGE